MGNAAAATGTAPEHRYASVRPDSDHKLEILLRISRTLGEEIHLDRMLVTMIAEVTKAMYAERTSLFLHDPSANELYTKVAEGLQIREIRIPLGVGIAGMAAETRTAINIPDAYEDPRFNPAFDRKSGFRTRSLLTMPILNQRGRLMGVVQVLNRLDGGAFTADDESFLSAICTHLALALERAELVESYVESQKLQQSLRLAHEIQMGLVPKTFPAFPDIPQLDIYAYLQPALDVGGDLYDFFTLDEHRLCFIVGDVSDKGIPAALFMAIVRTAFKISAMHNATSVASILQTVNRFICENNDSQMFVTVFCGVLDLRTGVVEYSDGGHEPPFLIRNGQSVEMLDKKGGVALGFLPDCAFPTGYIQLRPGDSLILYTDGVNEAFDTDRRMFRPSGIQDALNACTSDSSAEQVVRGLSESLRQFVGAAPQSDDITVLALKYVGTMS